MLYSFGEGLGWHMQFGAAYEILSNSVIGDIMPLRGEMCRKKMASSTQSCQSRTDCPVARGGEWVMVCNQLPNWKSRRCTVRDTMQAALSIPDTYNLCTSLYMFTKKFRSHVGHLQTLLVCFRHANCPNFRGTEWPLTEQNNQKIAHPRGAATQTVCCGGTRWTSLCARASVEATMPLFTWLQERVELEICRHGLRPAPSWPLQDVPPSGTASAPPEKRLQYLDWPAWS